MATGLSWLIVRTAHAPLPYFNVLNYLNGKTVCMLFFNFISYWMIIFVLAWKRKRYILSLCRMQKCAIPNTPCVCALALWQIIRIHKFYGMFECLHKIVVYAAPSVHDVLAHPTRCVTIRVFLHCFNVFSSNATQLEW